jgi:hypothetical protein
MRKPVFLALTMFAALFTCASETIASSARKYSTEEPRTTVIETSAGRRLVISTDPSGTKVTEEKSGREVWSSISDRHETKLQEYLKTGAKIIPVRK